MIGERRAALRLAAAAMLLVALSAFVYAQTGTFDFVLFDDDEYVYANPIVAEGLTPRGLVEAFRFRSGNWHPLTWISHMADVSAFGMSPGAHHVVSVLLHALNAILLMLVLARLTGALVPAAIVAALFAVHPLNVENVAWVSERKTLLSVALLLVALLLWERWVRRPTPRGMVAVVACFALGLMSKPLVITLPLLLLAFDYWPLRRLEPSVASVRQRIVEKLPLLASSLASALLTYRAQAVEGAVAAGDALSLHVRLLNALASVAWYVAKLVIPTELSFYYPHPSTLGASVSAAWAASGLVLIVAGISISVLVRRRAPYFGAGVAWFLVALVPVIGIVQVGLQARADRYAYLPMIGLLVAAVWSIDGLLGTSRGGRAMASAMAVGAIVVLGLAARSQAANWRDSETLFRHALEVDASNWAAWQNLGILALERTDESSALACFERAHALFPGNVLVLYNIGHVHSLRDEPRVAAEWYGKALERQPANVRALVAMALTCQQLGDLRGAVEYANRAIEADPDSPEALYGFALVSQAIGDPEATRKAVGRLRVIAPQLAAEFGR